MTSTDEMFDFHDVEAAQARCYTFTYRVLNIYIYWDTACDINWYEGLLWQVFTVNSTMLADPELQIVEKLACKYCM